MQSAFQGSFSSFADLPIVVEATATCLSSDAGLLAFREFDQRVGLTRSFADVLNDPRDPRRFDHSFLDMTRARVYGVLADYADQNDHDTLRSDPVFKLLADRSPDGPDLVTNRPGARVLPGAAYDDYAEGGEGENRNKELKCSLHIDRTSDHRFLANYFRLYLYGPAFNLLARFRRAVALPPQALTDAERRRHQQRCRQRDPLAQAQPCTWRMLLIKVAAEVLISTRRVVVGLSAFWPNLSYFQRVLQSLASIPSTLPPVPS